MKIFKLIADCASPKPLGLVLAGALLSAGCGGADTTDGVVVPDTRGDRQFDQMKEHMKNFNTKGGAAKKQ